MVLAIPLLDVSLCVMRRFLRNRPIFGADRGHIHHRLLDRGLHPRQVVLWIYAGCGLAAGFSLLQRVVRAPEVSILLLLVFGAALWIGVQFLNYSEFRVARSLILGGELQEVLNARLALQAHEQAVAAARTPEECWQAVGAAARALGFISLRARWQGELREEVFESAADAPRWTARVPLADGDFVELDRKVPAPESGAVVAPFLEMLQVGLAAKLAEAPAEVGPGRKPGAGS